MTTDYFVKQSANPLADSKESQSAAANETRLYSEAKDSPTRFASQSGFSLDSQFDASEQLNFAPDFDLEKIAQGVRMILEGVGEDPLREGLLDTPARVARMYRELLYGVGCDPADEVTCTFNEETDDIVIVKDIQFATICEHHMVPFIGTASVAYIPKGGRITGLSKIARVVELAARRLQLQERMTAQIADAMMSALKPHGVMVILRAEHLCMSIRGVKKPGSTTVTSANRGVLKEDATRRQEISQLL
jgi:GTP cyclohydrolase I